MRSRSNSLTRWLLTILLGGMLVAPALACPPLDEENKNGMAQPATTEVAGVEQENPVPDEQGSTDPPTLAQVLEREGLEAFARAARRADLERAVPTEGSITIFVPTNEAFDQLTDATKMALRSDRNIDNLRTILAHHVVEGRHTTEDLIGTSVLQTMSGQPVEIDASFGGIKIGRASVIEGDIESDRAIVHVIDRVLIPDDLTLIPDGSLLLGVYVRRPDSSVASELEMKRSGLLYVSSVINGTNAEAAGVLAGDIIFQIDHRPASVDAGEQAKKEKGVGNEVELRIIRDGERIIIMVPVGVEPR